MKKVSRRDVVNATPGKAKDLAKVRESQKIDQELVKEKTKQEIERLQQERKRDFAFIANTPQGRRLFLYLKSIMVPREEPQWKKDGDAAKDVLIHNAAVGQLWASVVSWLPKEEEAAIRLGLPVSKSIVIVDKE